MEKVNKPDLGVFSPLSVGSDISLIIVIHLGPCSSLDDQFTSHLADLFFLSLAKNMTERRVHLSNIHCVTQISI